MKKIFTLILALMMVLSLAACGNEKEKTEGDNNTTATSSQQVQTDEQNKSSVVNASNEAWISSTTNIAYVFYADGKYESYKLVDEVWKTNGNGTYKIDADLLTIDSTEYSYKLNDDTLTFIVKDKEYAYVKTSPFNLEQSSEGNLDERLVLADGQAWIAEGSVMITGYVFKADGTYNYYATDTWMLQSSGTWSTNGNILELCKDGNTTNYSYVVNGEGLTITSVLDDVYGPYVAQNIPSAN